MKIADFIRKHGIRMTCSRVSSNPAMSDFRGDHWRCALRSGRRRMTIVFSMGYGHGGQSPDLERVLDTMASDSAGFENTGDVGSWASEYGYESGKEAGRTAPADEA